MQAGIVNHDENSRKQREIRNKEKKEKKYIKKKQLFNLNTCFFIRPAYCICWKAVHDKAVNLAEL